jgi:mono/diheme cytochrome c family protein
MRKVLFAAAVAAMSGLALPGHAQAAGPGEALFNDNCAACHQRTGLGVRGAFPPLAGSKLVVGPPVGVATTVLVGRGGMPAFKSELTDQQLAAILTHIRSSWGNKAGPIKPTEVAAFRSRASATAQTRSLQAH